MYKGECHIVQNKVCSLTKCHSPLNLNSLPLTDDRTNVNIVNVNKITKLINRQVDENVEPRCDIGELNVIIDDINSSTSLTTSSIRP